MISLLGTRKSPKSEALIQMHCTFYCVALLSWMISDKILNLLATMPSSDILHRAFVLKVAFFLS